MLIGVPMDVEAKSIPGLEKKIHCKFLFKSVDISYFFKFWLKNCILASMISKSTSCVYKGISPPLNSSLLER